MAYSGMVPDNYCDAYTDWTHVEDGRWFDRIGRHRVEDMLLCDRCFEEWQIDEMERAASRRLKF